MIYEIAFALNARRVLEVVSEPFTQKNNRELVMHTAWCRIGRNMHESLLVFVEHHFCYWSCFWFFRVSVWLSSCEW
jgi:hypothetical protein